MADVEEQHPVAGVEEHDSIPEEPETTLSDSHLEPEQHEASDEIEATPVDVAADNEVHVPAADSEPAEAGVPGAAEIVDAAPSAAPEPEAKQAVPASPSKLKAKTSISTKPPGKAVAGTTVKKVCVDLPCIRRNVLNSYHNLCIVGPELWHVWIRCTENYTCNDESRSFLIYCYQTRLCDISPQENV